MRAGRPVLLAAAGVVAVLAVFGVWWGWSSRPAPVRLEPNWAATVTTIAGSGVDGVRDGTAFDAQFSDPFGIAAAPDGTIYVADAHRIRRVTADGRVATLAGGDQGFADGPAASARFSTPSGLALGPDHHLYVADTGNDAIRKISPDGQVSTVAGPGTGLNGPLGVAVDRHGRVVVADTYNDRIRAVDTAGRLVDVAGAGVPGFEEGDARAARFDTPSGVAVDAAGNIYVADAGNGAVRVVSADGFVTTIAPGYNDPVMRPVAIAAGTDGSVFVTDDRGRIVEITPDRGQRVLAGSRPGFQEGAGGAARFRAPAGIAVQAPGRLVVADRRNALVRIVAAASSTRFSAPAPPLAPRFDAVAFDRIPLLWPFAPIEGPFEITGTLGEPRGGEGFERLHAGLDVHAPEGTEVRLVRDGTATDPLAAADFDSINESIRIGPVTYVHLRVGRTMRNAAMEDRRFVVTRDEAGQVSRVRVKRGSRFAAGEVIGTVNRFYHAHLNVGWPGEELNPLAFRLPGLEDSVPPVIARGGVRIIGEDGVPVTRREKRRLVVEGRIRVVVDAWDQMDGNQARRRLGLYRLGYEILRADGSPVEGFERSRETLRFDRHAPDGAAARTVYASGSGIPVYGSRSTRFLYLVTSSLRDGVAADGALDTATLPPGDYTLRIVAADIRGNVALDNRDLPITVLRSSGE